MTIFDYYYRRRHLDRTTAIAISTGSALAHRNDTDALVLDFALPIPVRFGPYTGRRGTSETTIALAYLPVVASRLWLWPNRPLRLVQMFDADNRCAICRIDFATLPHYRNHECYQTDLYLDMFVTPDETEYAILDEDELELALSMGLISARQHDSIQTQAHELVQLLEQGQFGAWLTATCAAPFDIARLESKRETFQRTSGIDEPDGWPEGID